MTIRQVERLREEMPIQWNRIKREVIDGIQVIEHEPNADQLEYLRLRVAQLRGIFDQSMLVLHRVYERHKESKMTGRKLLVLSFAETMTFITGVVTGLSAVNKCPGEVPSWYEMTISTSLVLVSHLISKLKDVLIIRGLDEERNLILSVEALRFLLVEEQFLRSLEQGLLQRQSEQIGGPLIPWGEKRRLFLFLAEREQTDFVDVDLQRSLEELHLLA